MVHSMHHYRWRVRAKFYSKHYPLHELCTFCDSFLILCHISFVSFESSNNFVRGEKYMKTLKRRNESLKQNSTYAVFVATYWSCWIRKYLRTGRPWNIIYWWMEKIRYYLKEGHILGQRKSSLKFWHRILKTSGS